MYIAGLGEVKSRYYLSFYLFLVAMQCCSPAVAEIFKWVDADGVTHYAATAPKNSATDITTIQINQQKKTKTSLPKNKYNERIQIKAKQLDDQYLNKNRRVLPFSGFSDFKKAENSGLKRPVKQPKEIRGKNFESQQLVKSDFNGRIIGEVNFDGANLRESDFSRAIINPGVTFKNARLENVNFSRATLSQADFSGANLTGANFEFARCFECRFDQASLRNARMNSINIHNGSFESSDLSEVELSGVLMMSGVDFSSATGLDLEGLHQAVKRNPTAFRGISYEYQGCQIGKKGADCTGVNLEGHKFLATELAEMNFSRANLKSADLSSSSIVSSIFASADMSGSVIGNMNEHSDFRSANLSSAKFETRQIQGNFTGADLSGVDFTGKYLEGMILKNAKLSGIRYTDEMVDPHILNDADISGCKQCQQTLESSTVSPEVIKTYIDQVVGGGLKNILGYLVQKEGPQHYTSFINRRTTLSFEQQTELMLYMLDKKDDRLTRDFFTLTRNFGVSPSRDNPCVHPGIVRALIPYIRKGQKEDRESDRKPELYDLKKHIRNQAVACLSVNVPDNDAVMKKFQLALDSEPLDTIKWRLVQSLQDGSKASELHLVRILKSDMEKSANTAAYILKNHYSPDVRLIDWLLEKLRNDQFVSEGFYELLKAFAIDDRPSLSRLKEVRKMREERKWDIVYLDRIIHSYEVDMNNAKHSKRSG